MSIAKLFDSIAESYDRFNHLLSLNIDVLWRRSALKHLPSAEETVSGVPSGTHVLDVACGTADFSIELIKSGTATHVTGVDISTGMLKKGEEKVQKAGYADSIELCVADCAKLPYPDESFDLLTSAFGVRNFEQRAQSLKEMQRVLKKGGRLLILEFSTPRHFPVKQLYRLYFKHIMPMVGGWLSGNKAAYNYFFDSVYRFPQGEEFMSELLEAGFTRTKQRRMTFGIATAYYAAK